MPYDIYSNNIRVGSMIVDKKFSKPYEREMWFTTMYEAMKEVKCELRKRKK